MQYQEHNDGFKVINYDSFNFEQSAIIKPKTENFDIIHRIPTKTTSVIVNSAERNLDAYPTPASYMADLYEEIQDVISVELKFAMLPHNPYNVTKANNIVIISGTQVTLPSGKYNSSTLVDAFNNIFPVPVQGFQASYDPIAQHMLFSASVPFTFDGSSTNTYLKGSMHQLLGLTAKTQTAVLNVSDNKYYLKSTFVIDLTPNNTIIMNIDSMNVKVSATNVFNKAFGILPEAWTDRQIGDIYMIKKTFNPPVPRIDKLRIRFTDIYGNPYDFQNKVVLDIGSNQGGMLFAIQDKIKEGIRIDFNYKLVNIANHIKSNENFSNLNFFVFDLEQEDFDLIFNFIKNDSIDIIFLLSICMWIRNWKELCIWCSKSSKSMLFETNGSDQEQDEQIAFLKSIYSNILLINDRSLDDPRQHKRRLYFCEN
jgi:hypothetical protein